MGWLLTVRRWIRFLCITLGVGGALMVVFMMFLVTIDVFGRDAFNQPVLGSFELVEYSMVVAVFCALAVTQVHHFHINVDVLAAFLPRRARAVLDSITLSMMLGFYCVVTWMCYVQTMRMLAMMRTSSVLQIPRWPFQAMVALGMASLCLAVAVDLVIAVATAMGKEIEVKQEPEEALKTV